MRKIVFSGLIVLSAWIIMYAFFMPWARVKTSVTTLSKHLTSTTAGALKLKELPVTGKVVKGVEDLTDSVGKVADIGVKSVVKGYEIPKAANKGISKVAMAFLQVLFRELRGLDKKSYLVYLVPFLTLTILFLAIIGLKYKLSIMLVMILSGGASIGGFYNLMTADESSLPVQIVIEKGAWLTMCTFLFIFIVSITWLVLDRKRKTETEPEAVFNK